MNHFRLLERLASPLNVKAIKPSHKRMSSNLRQRSVVSSFICTAPESSTGFTFALFKRSQDVSTYPGKWAVCSGSIDPTDPSPEAAAKREILEETTLSDSDITLLRRGKPFSLTDEALKTKWTIHPFAWQLKAGAKPIKFDWEHTEYQFVKPNELDSFDHVPQLEIGLHRVLVSPEMEEGLSILRTDHESGAQKLALKAVQILQKMLSDTELARLGTSKKLWKELRWRAWHLAKNGRPSMGAAIEAALFNALENARKELIAVSANLDDIQVAEMRGIVDSAISSKVEARKQSLAKLAEHFVAFIDALPSVNEPAKSPQPTSIVTLSASGTVTQCLTQLIKSHVARGLNVHLTVLESRPNFEGTVFVQSLLESLPLEEKFLNAVKVDIVSDASVATVIKDANFFVFGGDKVIPNGDVSNKIGSLVTAVAAKTLNPDCKVVALFETDKIIGSEFDSHYYTIEYNDELEITQVWPSAALEGIQRVQDSGFEVSVKNAYFEWVPAKLIDHYITEQGIIEEHDIAKVAAKSQELEQRLFEDL